VKPVSLKLAGLHSFREPQTVDFERLCEAGLFGIFGPTGSGKSTVLDALTLALYGRVERAAYSTHGILNHAEDRVLVEFTFELDQPEGRKRYRVERVYRRSGDNSVTSAGARLLEIADGCEMPLAEKNEAVTREITSLLGLNADDFTRAVVLPQGKFDEFLKKIKPVDRRRMLERLFGLSEYGDRLRQKVDVRLNDARNKLASVQGELDGLGDASDEALESARKQFEEAARAADEADGLLRKAEKEHAEMEKVWAWQEEKAAVDRLLAGLRERGPEMEAARLKLDAAARAGKLLPFLQEADEAEKGIAEARENLNTVAEKLASAARAAEEAETAFEAARRQRLEEEPALLERKGRLVRAAGLETEAGGLEKEKSGLEEALKNLEDERSGNRASLQNLLKERSDLEKEIGSLKEGIAGTQVGPERRRRVSAALLALHRWKEAGEAERRAREDREKKEKLLSGAKEALARAAAAERESIRALKLAEIKERELREGCPEDEAALQDSLRELERLRSRAGEVSRLTRALDEAAAVLAGKKAELENVREAVRKAGANLAEAERRRDEARRAVRLLEEKVDELRCRNMAGHLAGLLREGAPCPVCGSVDHPAPAVTDGAAEIAAVEAELRDARDSAETALRTLEKAQREESAETEKLNSATEAAREAQDHLSALNAEMDAARGNLPVAWRDLPPAGLERELAAREDRLARSRQALADWRKELEEVRQALKKAQELYGSAKAAGAGAESACRAAEEAWREAVERELAAAAEADKCLVELDGARGDMAPGTIEEEQRRIERLDSERSGLEEKCASLEKKLAGVSAEIEKLSARDAGLAVQISKSRAELSALCGQLEQRKNEIVTITGGQPAGLLLSQTEARLKVLSANEQQAREEARRAAGEKNGLEQALAAAEKALSIAAERLEKSRERLGKNLDEMRFVTRNEAEQALLDGAEQESLRKAVEEYGKERERLEGLSGNLAEKLGGRKLSGEEWQRCRENLAAARRKREEALTARGVAVQQYEKLKLDNARWQEMNRRAREIGDLKEKLEILKDLLRGNAFVDFLAEEQLVRVAGDASARLGQFTKHRYALEVDSEGGFIIRDEANGGIKRPVSTLSGGETFVTSLALALALSAQIQLKGRYPLEFFFLDEGFGTLDPDLLEVVVSTLERLRLEHLNIGVISHVPELKNRLPRRLIVHPAEASGAGSRLVLETA